MLPSIWGLHRRARVEGLWVAMREWNGRRRNRERKIFTISILIWLIYINFTRGRERSSAAVSRERVPVKHEMRFYGEAWSEIDKWMKWTNSIMYVIRAKLLGLKLFRELFSCINLANDDASMTCGVEKGFIASDMGIDKKHCGDALNIPSASKLHSLCAIAVQSFPQFPPMLQPFPDVIFRLKRANNEEASSRKQIHGCDIDAKVVKCSWHLGSGERKKCLSDIKSTCE